VRRLLIFTLSPHVQRQTSRGIGQRSPAKHEINSRQWTRSRPLARPPAFGFTKFLSPFPKRLKSCNSCQSFLISTPHPDPLPGQGGEGIIFAWFAHFGVHLIRPSVEICFSQRPSPVQIIPSPLIPLPSDGRGAISRSRERGIYFAIFKPFSFQDSKPPSISMTE